MDATFAEGILRVDPFETPQILREAAFRTAPRTVHIVKENCLCIEFREREFCIPQKFLKLRAI